MLNILEAFFRRPWLHLLPLALLVAFGAFTAFNAPQEFRSMGSLNAIRNDQLTEITERNQAGFTYETPASITARSINEQLRTRAFVALVAQKVSPGETPENAFIRQEVPESVSASADGDNLVQVSATTADPQLSADLAGATLEAYRETVLTEEIEASEQSAAFLEQQNTAASEVLAEAQAAVDAFAIQQPGPIIEQPLDQQIAFARLEADVERAEARYGASLEALNAAELEAAQAQTVVEQRLRIQDEAEAPIASEPRLRKAILTVVLFIVLGIMLSLASVVVSATLDRTIRLPNDITGNFGLDVLAVIPEARRR